MEFKYINDRNKTPNSKVFSSTANCERFFNLPQDISTPPSRFSKIVNPFECRLVDRLHLTTFSPSVFAKQSTPKTEEKFRWTIDEISSLKPADIDEETISQHVVDEDPHMESIVQQKIDQFFSEKVIVPSPMIDIIRVPFITDSPANLFLPKQPKEYSDGSAQTMLSLPPVLPAHIEDILKPYFMPEESEPMHITDPITEMKNSYLFRNLFRNCDNMEPPEEDHIVKSPSMLAENFSPLRSPVRLTGRHSLPFEMPDLHECSLSPIGDSHNNRSSKDSRSAVRLDFSNRSSSDASMAVPDIGNEASTNSELLEFSQYNPQPLELLSESPVNWDMENGHVSLVTPENSPESKIMDVTTNTTPHSKIFTSQRKRLSHSFIIDEEEESKKENDSSVDNLKQSRKFFRNDVTDAGYHTESANFYEESRYSVHMFASTPTKMRRNENVQESPQDLIF